MDNKELASSGVSITTVLTLIFLVLKLTGLIEWSWFWVLSPIIFEIALVLVIVLAICIVAIYCASKQDVEKDREDDEQ